MAHRSSDISRRAILKTSMTGTALAALPGLPRVAAEAVAPASSGSAAVVRRPPRGAVSGEGQQRRFDFRWGRCASMS